MVADLQGGNRILKPFKWYRDLAAKPRLRKTEGCFLIEGRRAIGQVLHYCPDHIIEIITFERDLPMNYAGPRRFVTQAEYGSLSPSITPRGPLAVASIPDKVYSNYLPEEPGTRIVVLEDVQDPGNVGALIRAAAAFDYDGILLSAGCADPFAPKVIQATAGSVYALWLRKVDDFIASVKHLSSQGYSLVGTSSIPAPAPLQNIPQRHALVLGNEGNGLSRSLRDTIDHMLTIEMNSGKVESLNVALAGAVCMDRIRSHRNT
ncbi:MAG: hypothetical protein GF398_21245 [Chitinivibrionales bacterium]|nr:hypothetical protein [Chitinivibrionales bacterium]